MPDGGRGGGGAREYAAIWFTGWRLTPVLGSRRGKGTTGSLKCLDEAQEQAELADAPALSAAMPMRDAAAGPVGVTFNGDNRARDKHAAAAAAADTSAPIPVGDNWARDKYAAAAAGEAAVTEAPAIAPPDESTTPWLLEAAIGAAFLMGVGRLAGRMDGLTWHTAPDFEGPVPCDRVPLQKAVHGRDRGPPVKSSEEACSGGPPGTPKAVSDRQVR